MKKEELIFVYEDTKKRCTYIYAPVRKNLNFYTISAPSYLCELLT